MKNMASILILFFCISCVNEDTKSSSASEKNISAREEKKIKRQKDCDSLSTYYYSDGRKESEGCWVNGKKHGIWKAWTYNDHPLSSVNLIIHTMEYENGNLILKVDSSMSPKTNRAIVIYSSHYISPDSVIQEQISYHLNGKLESIGGSISARSHGISKIWDENGSLMSESINNNGTCVSYKKYNSENGILVREETFHGTCASKTEKEYDRETGKLIAIREYKDNKLVSEKKY